MANRNFNLPIKGFSEALPPDKQPILTSGYINNIYPFGALDNKIRLVQRPGMDNVFAQQVSSTASPVVAICSVTVVS